MIGIVFSIHSQVLLISNSAKETIICNTHYLFSGKGMT